MIQVITQVEYRKLKRIRRQGKKLGYLIFKCEDGKYYKTDKSGMAGTKEMVEQQRVVRNQISKSVSLF